MAVWFYVLLSRVFGFTFAARLLERWERRDQQCYEELAAVIPEAARIRKEECGHEAALLQMLDEPRLHYAGSMILGLSDALVELTGVLAGLTLALQETRLVALTGLITGVAAALSMAASSYLSTQGRECQKPPDTGSASIRADFVLPYLSRDRARAAVLPSTLHLRAVNFSFTALATTLTVGRDDHCRV